MILVVSLVFWIRIKVWIKIYMCSYSGYWILDLHLRDKDLFDINFVSYLFIYLLICLFVFMYLQHLFV